MTKDEVEKYVNDILNEYFEIEKNRLEPEKQLFDDLGLDSLDLVDLVAALQRKFDINIRDDERIQEIRKLEDIYSYILTLEEEGKISVNSDVAEI